MFALILTKALAERVSFSILALFLIKALKNEFFFFYFFAPYSHQNLTKMVFFSSIFALTLTKSCHKGCFLHFCPYSNKRLTKKGVYSIFAIVLSKALPKRVISFFALNLTKALPQRVVFNIFALILTKVIPKRMCFSIFALTLTKALPQRVFSLFLPLF